MFKAMTEIQNQEGSSDDCPAISWTPGLGANVLQTVYLATRVSPWTPELQARVLELWKEGLPTSKIGERVGLTKNQVIGWLDRNRVKRAVRTPLQSHRWPQEVQDTITALWDAGTSVWRIGEITGRNRKVVARWIADHYYDGPTTMDRLQAMHDKMDVALAMPARRVPPPQEKI